MHPQQVVLGCPGDAPLFSARDGRTEQRAPSPSWWCQKSRRTGRAAYGASASPACGRGCACLLDWFPVRQWRLKVMGRNLRRSLVRLFWLKLPTTAYQSAGDPVVGRVSRGGGDSLAPGDGRLELVVRLAWSSPPASLPAKCALLDFSAPSALRGEAAPHGPISSAKRCQGGPLLVCGVGSPR